MTFRFVPALMLVVLLALTPLHSEALGRAYMVGYYSGHTSQGAAISFVVAHGRVSQLFGRMVDSCGSGKWYVTLTPKAAPVNAAGDWVHRTPGSFPTTYHGHLSGANASGTIDDLSKNNVGRSCHGHVSFVAQRGNPLSLGRSTVGARGTDVLLTLGVPAINDGNAIVPRTNLALLVYGSNRGCPGTYRAADALARSAESFGFIGLISDAYVTADYGFALFKSYNHGTFTFDVSSNTLLPAPSGRSPFSTVCAMLYSGNPATLTPSRDTALETIRGPLVRGPGIPNTQP